MNQPMCQASVSSQWTDMISSNFYSVDWISFALFKVNKGQFGSGKHEFKGNIGKLVRGVHGPSNSDFRLLLNFRLNIVADLKFLSLWGWFCFNFRDCHSVHVGIQSIVTIHSMRCTQNSSVLSLHSFFSLPLGAALLPIHPPLSLCVLPTPPVIPSVGHSLIQITIHLYLYLSPASKILPATACELAIALYDIQCGAQLQSGSQTGQPC